MPRRVGTETLYYRSKAAEVLSAVCGAGMVAFAAIVLTRDSLFGVPFGTSFLMMTTYLLLPFGAILFLAKIGHVISMGPTLSAGEDGIDVLFPRRPVGVIRWSEIDGFVAFRYQWKWHLGVTLQDPQRALAPFRDRIGPLMPGCGPKTAHLVIPGKMLDVPVCEALDELEEMRRARSWRA